MQKIKEINNHVSKGQVSCHRVSASPQKGFRPSGTHPDYPARKAGKAARLREGGLQKADGLVSFLRQCRPWKTTKTIMVIRNTR